MLIDRSAPTVAIIAPDRHARARVRAALAGAGAQVVGEAWSRMAGGELLERLDPDVAVVDACLLSTSEFFLTGWGPVSRSTRLIAVGPDDPGLERRLRSCDISAYLSWVRLAELPAAVADASGRALSPASSTSSSTSALSRRRA